MLIALISTLLRLFSKLSIIVHYFPYLLSVVLFILSGPWFQIIMVLCVVAMAYETMKYVVMTLTCYLYSVTSSTLYFGNCILETISNYTYCFFPLGSQSVEGKGEDIFPYLLTHPFSFTTPVSSWITLPSSFTTLLSPELVTIALQDIEYSWDTQTTIVLLFCLMNALQVLLKVKQLLRKHRRWKAAVWSPTRRVAEAAEGEGESSQFAEVKAIQLALDIAEREKWPVLYLYTDSWMVANALWGWLQQWKQNNWQRRGKPIWAAALWQDIAARVENLAVKVCHVDAHVPKNRATEEHQNNQQVDQAAKIEVAQVDLDWQHKGELFIARWAHDTSGHQGRDATYRWARDRGVDLTMDAIAQVIHDCETCAAIKQAKRSKPLWYGGRWLKYKYGEAWQIDYITLPQTRNGKRHVLTMVEATTRWLETYPVPHATARNTILGLEKQVLWRHGTPERIESDNGTHFRNNLIDTWAKEHGIEWVYHIPYHAPASGKVERYNGLLKTTLKAMGAGTFKNWDTHLAKATWLVNTRGSTNRAGPAQSNLLRTVDGDKVPVVHVKNMLGKTVWATPASGKGKPIRGIVFAQGPGYTWWVMQKNGEVRCVPQGDLILGENSP
uniref:Uncharacterized protein n=1 Tax=Anas platyrhynchos platyrhynchos TaxID=8840 RepID=A0A493TT96_ANAPP